MRIHPPEDERKTYEVTFVAARSRVAPLKQLTIPRLKLQAAVLASRLVKSILDESRIQFESLKFLNDSTSTLYGFNVLPGALNRLSRRGWGRFKASQIQINGNTTKHNTKRRHVNAVSAASKVDIGNVINPKVFTSWGKLLRIPPWLGRLAEKIRSRRNQLGGRDGILMPEELAKAEIL